MSKDFHTITVICASGRPFRLGGAGMDTGGYYTNVVDLADGYFSTLDIIKRDMAGGGTNYDRPKLLFIDGVERDKDVGQRAHDYCTERDRAFAEAAKKVKDDFTPPWLKDEGGQ